MQSHKVKLRHSEDDKCKYGPDDSNPYAMALIPSERKRLEEYLEKFPKHVYDLNQNLVKKLISPTDGNLHTIIRNCGLVWNPTLQPPRWLVPQEIALAMGLPVDPDSVATTGVSCWMSRVPATGAANNAHRTHRSSLNQLGNSMHVNAIGAVVMAVMLGYPSCAGSGSCNEKKRPLTVQVSDSSTLSTPEAEAQACDEDAQEAALRGEGLSDFAQAALKMRLAKRVRAAGC